MTIGSLIRAIGGAIATAVTAVIVTSIVSASQEISTKTCEKIKKMKAKSKENK